MFYRDLIPKKDVTQTVSLVHVLLPLRLTQGDAEAAISDPFAQQLAATGRGFVTDCRARRKISGEVSGVDLFLALNSAEDEDLRAIAHMLESLGAPKGSRLRLVDGGPELKFGRAMGLGIYVDSRRVRDEANAARLADACVSALGKIAYFHGTARVQERLAFYFYGADYGQMKQSLTEKIGRHPELRGAVARPLH